MCASILPGSVGSQLRYGDRGRDGSIEALAVAVRLSAAPGGAVRRNAPLAASRLACGALRPSGGCLWREAVLIYKLFKYAL